MQLGTFVWNIAAKRNNAFYKSQNEYVILTSNPVYLFVQTHVAQPNCSHGCHGELGPLSSPIIYNHCGLLQTEGRFDVVTLLCCEKSWVGVLILKSRSAGLISIHPLSCI